MWTKWVIHVLFYKYCRSIGLFYCICVECNVCYQYGSKRAHRPVSCPAFYRCLYQLNLIKHYVKQVYVHCLMSDNLYPLAP